MDVIRVERVKTETVHGADSVQSDWIGSGVAFVVYEARRKRGFVAHVLPVDWERGGTAGLPLPEIEDLRNWLEEMATAPTEVQAVVVGGAQPLNAGEDARLKLGEALSGAVKQGLRSLGIDQIHEDIGGSMGRRLLLNCHSGAVTITHGLGSSTTHYGLGG